MLALAFGSITGSRPWGLSCFLLLQPPSAHLCASLLYLIAHLPPAPPAQGEDLRGWEEVRDFPEASLTAGSACTPCWNAVRSFPRHPGKASWGLCAWLFWSIFLSHTPPCGIRPIKTLQSAAFTLRGSECLEGPLPRHTMAARTVPHAYPMSLEYEFANPSKIYDQNFGEGKKGDGIPLAPFSPLVQEG